MLSFLTQFMYSLYVSISIFTINKAAKSDLCAS